MQPETDGVHPPIPAAQYVRMSTEHQQYSTANQEDAIRDYAATRGYTVVETFADDGKSGLRIEDREQLRRMIGAVESGVATFKAILVYDISRWGRFQDADESAFYEYLCKRAGIDVHYCAEQFENDGGPASTIIKSVKRAMAGEYSRELSSKVFKGQCRLIELGYRQGGPAGIGLRRMLVDIHGDEKGLLQQGDRKSLQTDRVILVPGPDEEIAVVIEIYRMFTEQGLSELEIAETLNVGGSRTDLGRPWTRTTVREVLTNEKYIGNNVYNRRSFKLKKARVRNPPEMWVRADGAFEAIVSPDLYYVARGIIKERSRRLTNEQLLALLRELLDKHGTLSSYLIDATEGLPSSAVYRSRFGSLLAAYQLAGFAPERDYSYISVNRDLKTLRPQILQDFREKLMAVGATIAPIEATDLFLVNGEYSASLVISRCRSTPTGSLRWMARFDPSFSPDITVLVRMDASNTMPADYYLLPIMDIESPRLLLCEVNGAYLDTYQFDNLDFLAELSARDTFEIAA